jgi:alpha-mannosidase
MESELDAGDTYTWAPAAGDRPIVSRRRVRVRTLAAGAYAGVLEARWMLAAGRHPAGVGRGGIDVRLLLRLHRGSRLLHVTLDLDNGAIDHRLRLRMPIGLPRATLLTGRAFGVERRRSTDDEAAGSPCERPVATVPAHRFAAAAAGTRGLALFAPGFCELEWTPGGDLLFTALRAVGQLSRGDLPVRPGHAGWPTATPLAQCLGSDRIELAIAPVSAHDLERPAALHRLWEDAFLPTMAWWLRDAVPPLASGAGVSLEGEGLVMSALKPAAAGPGLVLRCYNPGASAVSARWRFTVPRAAAVQIRADEQEPAPAPLVEGGLVVPFDAAPGAWVTHLVR